MLLPPLDQKSKVVPYVGTWIEMVDLYRDALKGDVVPYVGTWIEMMILLLQRFAMFGRSLRGNVDRNIII